MKEEKNDKSIEDELSVCGITNEELQNRLIFATTKNGRPYYKEIHGKTEKVNNCAANVMEHWHEINQNDDKKNQQTENVARSIIADKSRTR
jgi:hypothetical protein